MINNEKKQINLEDILITSQLARRLPKSPDWQGESQAMHTLVRQLAKSPQTILKTLVRVALDLCLAGTAGISLLEENEDGEEIFRWVALAGKLEQYEGGSTPGEFSPCGICLQRQAPTLYLYPERYFTYFQQAKPAIVEGLVIPFNVDEQQKGTIWIVSHDATRHFDSEDVRIMTSLGEFTAVALQSSQDRITAQEAKLALQESQAQVQSLISNMPGMVYRYLPCVHGKDRFSFVSSGCRDLFEVEPAVALQNAGSIWNLIHPEDKALFTESVETAAKNFLPWDWQGRIITPSGELKWVQGRSNALHVDGVEVCSGLLIDITETKQATEALRESERLKNSILESSTDCIKVLTLNREIIYMNAGGLCLLEIEDSKAILNADWLSFWQGKDIKNAETAILAALSGNIGRFQGYCPTLQCNPKWWDVVVSPVRDAAGSVVQLLVISRDITEVKRIEKAREDAEIALRLREEQSRNILESITDAFFALDENWCFTYINQFGEVLLDRPPSSLIGKNIWEQYPGLIDSEFAIIYRKAMCDRVSGTLTAFYPDHNRWYDVRTYPATNGITVYFNNVTGQIQAKESVRLSQARFRRIFDSKMIGIGIWNRSGEILDANDALLDMIGYTRQDLESGLLNWQEITPTQYHWRDEQAVAEITAKGVCSYYEKEYIHKQGKRIPILIGAGGFADTNEQGVFFTLDLSERKAAEAEREKLLQQEQVARKEAEKANRIKDEFLAVLSHELRSPLNPILGWTNMLLKGKLDPASQAKALTTIERNAKLQAQLIEDLLDISRIMQGKLSLNAESVNLVLVIQAALETVRLAAEAKNIQITLDLDWDTASVFGDAGRLQQVVCNLLTNAVKFTPPGGQVTVELRQIEGLIQLRVIDTGKGINPQFLPHVFEYFRQEDSSTTRKYGGLGLGLAIVRQIVEMHGGTVRVESPGENQGATFIVQLPALQQVVPYTKEASQETMKAETPLNNLQILLVDDDTDTREFQAFLLTQNGAKVTAVASAFEALQALDRFLPDLLVSDIGMEQMDGYSLIQEIRLRSVERGGVIPAVALTAYAGEVNEARVLQAGFQKYLTKPIDSLALVATITQLIMLSALS